MLELEEHDCRQGKVAKETELKLKSSAGKNTRKQVKQVKVFNYISKLYFNYVPYDPSSFMNHKKTYGLGLTNSPLLGCFCF